MGKISGAITSIIGIGVLAFLIYYCCIRRRRQRTPGAVIHVTTARIPPVQPNSMPYNPTNPVPVVPPGQYGYPYPTHNQSGGYPTDLGGQPYYPYPAQPYAPGSGQPMPMPMPLEHSQHVQGTAPYPTAPPPQFNDLPPPYSEVTKR